MRRYLVAWGADPHQTNNLGQNALHLARGLADSEAADSVLQALCVSDEIKEQEKRELEAARKTVRQEVLRRRQVAKEVRQMTRGTAAAAAAFTLYDPQDPLSGMTDEELAQLTASAKAKGIGRNMAVASQYSNRPTYPQDPRAYQAYAIQKQRSDAALQRRAQTAAATGRYMLTKGGHYHSGPALASGASRTAGLSASTGHLAMPTGELSRQRNALKYFDRQAQSNQRSTAVRASRVRTNRLSSSQTLDRAVYRSQTAIGGSRRRSGLDTSTGSIQSMGSSTELLPELQVDFDGLEASQKARLEAGEGRKPRRPYDARASATTDQFVEERSGIVDTTGRDGAGYERVMTQTLQSGAGKEQLHEFQHFVEAKREQQGKGQGQSGGSRAATRRSRPQTPQPRAEMGRLEAEALSRRAAAEGTVPDVNDPQFETWCRMRFGTVA